MILFQGWESFNGDDAELGPALPHLCGFSILWRVEPASCCLHCGELKNGHAARGVSAAFKQNVSLAACEITRTTSAECHKIAGETLGAKAQTGNRSAGGGVHRS
jgi:hypothetical protein